MILLFHPIEVKAKGAFRSIWYCATADWSDADSYQADTVILLDADLNPPFVCGTGVYGMDTNMICECAVYKNSAPPQCEARAYLNHRTKNRLLGK